MILNRLGDYLENGKYSKILLASTKMEVGAASVAFRKNESREKLISITLDQDYMNVISIVA